MRVKAKYNPKRWNKRLGPFRWNFSNFRFTSFSFKLWIFSWNSRRKNTVRADTVGPGSWSISLGDDE